MFLISEFSVLFPCFVSYIFQNGFDISMSGIWGFQLQFLIRIKCVDILTLWLSHIFWILILYLCFHLQALFVLLFLPFLSNLKGIPFSQLPSFLKSGAGCFFNTGNDISGYTSHSGSRCNLFLFLTSNREIWSNNGFKFRETWHNTLNICHLKYL